MSFVKKNPKKSAAGLVVVALLVATLALFQGGLLSSSLGLAQALPPACAPFDCPISEYHFKDFFNLESSNPDDKLNGLATDLNVSGLSYNPDSDTFYEVSDAGNRMYEITPEGEVLRTIYVGLGDSEGNEHIRTEADGTVKMVIVDEQIRGAFIVAIPAYDGTRVVPAEDVEVVFDYRFTDIPTAKGFSGVTYDSANDLYYLIGDDTNGLYAASLFPDGTYSINLVKDMGKKYYGITMHPAGGMVINDIEAAHRIDMAGNIQDTFILYEMTTTQDVAFNTSNGDMVVNAEWPGDVTTYSPTPYTPTRDPGLFAHYAFEDNLNDSSGYGQHAGAFRSAAFYTSGISGQALNLTGTNTEGVALPIFDDLHMDALSINFWYRPVNVGTNVGTILQPSIRKSKDSIIAEIKLDANGRIQASSKFGFGLNCYAPGGGALQNDTWYMITTVADEINQNGKLYINGQLCAADNNVTFAQRNFLGSGQIGYAGPNLSKPVTAGSVDELRLYDRILTDQEIADIYAGNVPPEEPPANTPPVLTVIGENPIVLIEGDTFTDPGATASDTEDGDLTSQIIVTGTVDTNTVGSYTLNYAVTDSGDLSDSKNRTVIVNELPPQVPNECNDGIDNDGDGQTDSADETCLYNPAYVE